MKRLAKNWKHNCQRTYTCKSKNNGRTKKSSFIFLLEHLVQWTLQAEKRKKGWFRWILKLLFSQNMIQFFNQFFIQTILRPYVTKMKPNKHQDDKPSTPIDMFNDHYIQVYDMTSTQDHTQKCHNLELVGEPLRQDLNFTVQLEHVTELIVLEKRTSSVSVDKFGVIEENIPNGKRCSQTKNQSYASSQILVLWSFPSRLCSDSGHETFAIINMPPSNMGWVIDNHCTLWSTNVFWRLSRTWKLVSSSNITNHYSPILAFAVSKRYMQLLNNICNLPSLLVPRKYWSSRW